MPTTPHRTGTCRPAVRCPSPSEWPHRRQVVHRPLPDSGCMPASPGAVPLQQAELARAAGPRGEPAGRAHLLGDEDLLLPGGLAGQRRVSPTAVPSQPPRSSYTPPYKPLPVSMAQFPPDSHRARLSHTPLPERPGAAETQLRAALRRAQGGLHPQFINTLLQKAIARAGIDPPPTAPTACGQSSSCVDEGNRGRSEPREQRWCPYTALSWSGPRRYTRDRDVGYRWRWRNSAISASCRFGAG